MPDEKVRLAFPRTMTKNLGCGKRGFFRIRNLDMLTLEDLKRTSP